jgi:hypothetical protein
MTINLRFQNVIRATARLVKHQAKNNNSITLSTDKAGIEAVNPATRLAFSFRKILLAFLIVMIGGLSAASPACAMCQDGAEASCVINGKAGTKECIMGRWGPCIANPVTEPPVSGTLQPKYYILAVIYAPPGTQGGGSKSSVAYGSGSTIGSTVSSSNSFKQNYSVSVSAEAGFLGSGGEVGASYSYGRNSSNSQSLEIKKTSAHEISVTGPSTDGIDHDRDLIYLWLNPKLNLRLTATQAVWGLGNNGLVDIQYVYVGWLKDPSLMPPGVAQRLQAYGITSADYSEMLKTDPFANGATAIDSERYQADALHTTFPYEPPYAPGESVPLMKFTAVYSDTASSSSSLQKEHSVGLTLSGSASFIDLVKTKFKNQNTWTWTNTNTSSSSTSTSESASVTVAGPAYGYTGPTDMVVYYDLIYKTFLFAPVEPTFPLALSGSVENTSGEVLSGKEVVVMANGTLYRTFTNAKGEYRIFGNISGPLLLSVDNVWKPIQQIPLQKRFDVVLP